MSTRAIYIPATGKWVSVGAYVKAVKLAKANQAATFKHGITCWWPVTGAEIMRQFREGMNDRINEGIPYAQRGMAR